MKSRFYSTIALLVGCVSLLAEDIKTNAPARIIPASQAGDFIGSTATVTGLVAEVHQTAKVTRLNFEKPFPKQPFTAVIFANRTNLFPNVAQLQGKPVAISGKIAEFRDRPEIVLNSTNQLKVLGSTSPEPAPK